MQKEKEALAHWFISKAEGKTILQMCENHFWRKVFGMKSLYEIKEAEYLNGKAVVSLRCVDCGSELRLNRETVDDLLNAGNRT